jgi:hypothetical protein
VIWIIAFPAVATIIYSIKGDIFQEYTGSWRCMMRRAVQRRKKLTDEEIERFCRGVEETLKKIHERRGLKEREEKREELLTHAR